MLDKFFGASIHKNIHLLGALVVAIGLPLNKVVMSIGTLLLILNIFLKADFKNYWKRIKSNRLIGLIIALFLFHVIGLLWSEDITYGLKDLRIKLPFIVIPLAFLIFPMSPKRIHWVLFAFLISLTVTSSVNFIWGTVYNSYSILEPREISLFGSHIRYGLLIVFGLSITFIKGIQTKNYCWWIWVLWFLVYTLFSQVLSAYFALSIVVFGLLFYWISRIPRNGLKIPLLLSLSLLLIAIPVGTFQLLKPKKVDLDTTTLPTHTALGNPYTHHLESQLTENGHPILWYICEKELQENWNNRSSIDFDSTDKNGHSIPSTLIRYMASKGLTKDAEGMKALSDKDIHSIEQGIPTIQIANGSSLKRIEELKFEIQLYYFGESPSGNSLFQRLEYWKTGWYIIKHNWLLGVGTGDVQNEFDAAYDELDSPLDAEFRHRAHNQFLTFWISFGIGGVLLFSAIWFLLLKQILTSNDLIGLCFVLIALASFIPEDTLETQQGVTFVALFLGLFGFGRKHLTN